MPQSGAKDKMGDSAKQDVGPSGRRPARVLIVEDDADLLETVVEIVTRETHARVTRCTDLRGARRLLTPGPSAGVFDLLVTDVHLPDGDGMSLLGVLGESNPHASAIVITGNPSIDNSVAALRAGAVDYLPKPFSGTDLADRVTRALGRQTVRERDRRRLSRLRQAVRRLNTARRHVNQKVDLLCHDLVNAYGDLAKQVATLRTEEAFQSLLHRAADLEQLLCHTMDWLLRTMGYCNIAIYVACDAPDDCDGEHTDEGLDDEHASDPAAGLIGPGGAPVPRYELGAYMKYTLAGDKPLTDALAGGLLMKVATQGAVRFSGLGPADYLTVAERPLLKRHAILGENCTYLGESLAGILLFRDAGTPFSDEDADTLRAVAPVFATTLASLVRRVDDDTPPHDGASHDGSAHDGSAGGGPAAEVTDRGDPSDLSEPPRRGNLTPPSDPPNKPQPPADRHQADWWKRGEPPPY